MNAVSNPVTHPAFEFLRRENLESLGISIEEYRHRETGAIHLHMNADSDENVFMVALRTVPKDSTGVAHILEHTVLCGSEKYPVRDPFFMMLRRSLNTFMNAFTSSDWTAYPFATQNQKDFDNLLSVYLDAVFFSRLDPLDFAQEGHREELESDDADAPLVYKGVVFNEMKGAMSSISSVLWDRLCFELFPTNTYHYNSGGDPEVIPDLSYEQLLGFYKGHYHPSNSIFLTFGNLPAAQHHTTFQDNVLSRFEASDQVIKVDLEKAFAEPISATHHYVLEDADTSNKTHLIMGWKLGESANLDDMLEAQVISSVLMENSASPLMQWLESNDLGTAPSPLCGLEDSMREMVFCCGIEGSEASHAEAFESNVLSVIEKTIQAGVANDRLTAILHQIELHQREVTGDGMPYGLNLMLRALGAATHFGDAVEALDLDPAVKRLQAKLNEDGYIESRMRSLLLDNPHRVRLTVAPDPSLDQTRKEREKERLSDLRSKMDANDIERTRSTAIALEARQRQTDDPGVLPKVGLEDIPSQTNTPSLQQRSSTKHSHSLGTAGTNGLVYQQMVMALPALSTDDTRQLPLMASLLTEVGIGDSSFLDIQDRQSAVVGSISASMSTRAARDDVNDVSGHFIVSSKALTNRIEAQAELMVDTLTQARFDEVDRIKDLVSQARARRDQSISGAGHSLAMTAACAGMSPLAAMINEQSGLAGIKGLRDLDDGLKDRDQLTATSLELTMLRDKLLSTTPKIRLLSIADETAIDSAADQLDLATSALSEQPASTLWQPSNATVHHNQVWAANTQVSFCAKAYPTVASGHPDAPILSVLGAYLRNGFLHRAIREQGGAYGGGASHDSNVGAFRFFSYRDPRTLDTFSDFDASIEWLLSEPANSDALEQAILSIISSLDKPASPAGEVKKAFYDELYGRTDAHRQAVRQGILNTSHDDLVRVASTYLTPERGVSVLLTDAGTAKSQQIADLNWQFNDLT